jgi:Protein of unknown function (DUF2934)
MNHTGTTRSKSGNSMEEGLQEDMEQRQEGRRTIERNEQQDLNQGMNTGTHSSAYRGLNWGPSYRMRSKIEQPRPMKEQIEARAYELYLQRGGGDGQDIEDWLIAEKEFESRG